VVNIIRKARFKQWLWSCFRHLHQYCEKKTIDKCGWVRVLDATQNL